jgi:MFS transporter, UMF1 family
VTDASQVLVDPASRRREHRGWYVYDWANSTFSTTVVSVFLGPYLTDVAKDAADPDGFVHVLGVPIRATALFTAAVFVSVALQILVLPVVGALADRSGRKRLMLATFAYTGAVATILLVTVHDGRFLLGAALFVVANLSLGASVVVYNAFLPEIATPDERDGVSSRGWAIGYLGGAILLAINLGLYGARGSLGLDKGGAVRLCLLSAGIWWAVFTVVPLVVLRDRPPRAVVDAGRSGPVRAGFTQLGRTITELRGFRQSLLFLVAFLLYNDGIQAAISFSATYGSEELGLGQGTLASAILLVQVVAFAGGFACGRVAARVGAKRTVLATLVVWAVVVATAALLPAGRPLPFFLLATTIGLVLGGSQALSRSLFSQLIPAGREAEYFGLYEISDSATSAIGALMIFVTLQATGSYRLAIAALVVFFVVGYALLRRVDVARGIREVGNETPSVL